jgi:uncharacterized lipoprotein YddW (UPF0748 family)
VAGNAGTRQAAPRSGDLWPPPPLGYTPEQTMEGAGNMHQRRLIGILLLACVCLCGPARAQDSKPILVLGSGLGDAWTHRMGTRGVVACLDALKLPYKSVQDADLSAADLAGVSLVVLPYNPDLPPSAAELLRAFAARGGRFIAFYDYPKPLQDTLGLGAGKWTKERRDGEFLTMRPNGDVLAGAPESILQPSRYVMVADVRAKVAGWWHDRDGRRTDRAAVVLTPTCSYVSQILMPSQDAEGSRRLLQALVARHLPRVAAEAALGRMGQVGPFRNLARAEAELGGLAWGRPRARELLEQAATGRTRAGRHYAEGRYGEALNAVEAVNGKLKEAFFLCQSPRAGEVRAVWTHYPDPPAGMTWDEAIRLLAENGFNMILPNLSWGDTAYYRSSVLHSDLTNGDRLAEIVAACRKYGVQCHVWRVCWQLKRDDVAAAMQQAGRTTVAFDGTRRDHWLSPAVPENRQLEIDAMVEIATNYDVDGVHFDYIRYQSSDYCFSPASRREFERRIGRAVAGWPSDVRGDGPLKEQWLQFRRDNITDVVRRTSAEIRRLRPKVRISAAVFPQWTGHRDWIGQDWVFWCRQGYLDLVFPMNYTPDTAKLRADLRTQLGWVGHVPLISGIGYSTLDLPDPFKAVEQIEAVREEGVPGFCIFQYRSGEARELIPLLGVGLTRPD